MLTKLKLIYWKWTKTCCEEDIADIKSYLLQAEADGFQNESTYNANLELKQALKEWRKADTVIAELERKLR